MELEYPIIRHPSTDDHERLLRARTKYEKKKNTTNGLIEVRFHCLFISSLIVI